MSPRDESFGKLLERVTEMERLDCQRMDNILRLEKRICHLTSVIKDKEQSETQLHIFYLIKTIQNQKREITKLKRKLEIFVEEKRAKSAIESRREEEIIKKVSKRSHKNIDRNLKREREFKKKLNLARRKMFINRTFQTQY